MLTAADKYCKSPESGWSFVKECSYHICENINDFLYLGEGVSAEPGIRRSADVWKQAL